MSYATSLFTYIQFGVDLVYIESGVDLVNIQSGVSRQRGGGVVYGVVEYGDVLRSESGALASLLEDGALRSASEVSLAACMAAEG